MEDESTIITKSMETMTPIECPSCGHKGMKSIVSTLELPMLGEALQTTLICPECGFRTADVLITAQSEPVRYVMRVEGPDDVDARVIRSTSGTIRIPELGVVIEPGPASESFISNIEGVLMRVKEVVEGLEHDDPEGVKKKLGEISRAMKGEMRYTFIIEDPFGNSAIIHEKAKKELLKPEEAARLKTGEITLSTNDK